MYFLSAKHFEFFRRSQNRSKVTRFQFSARSELTGPNGNHLQTSIPPSGPFLRNYVHISMRTPRNDFYCFFIREAEILRKSPLLMFVFLLFAIKRVVLNDIGLLGALPRPPCPDVAHLGNAGMP